MSSLETQLIALIDRQNALIEQQLTVLARLVERLDGDLPEWGNRQQAAQVLDCHPTTFDRRHRDWQQQGHWLEGVHWQAVPGQHPVFNLVLLKDLRQHAIDSVPHLQCIRRWQQGQRRGR